MVDEKRKLEIIQNNHIRSLLTGKGKRKKKTKRVHFLALKN